MTKKILLLTLISITAGQLCAMPDQPTDISSFRKKLARHTKNYTDAKPKSALSGLSEETVAALGANTIDRTVNLRLSDDQEKVIATTKSKTEIGRAHV